MEGSKCPLIFSLLIRDSWFPQFIYSQESALRDSVDVVPLVQQYRTSAAATVVVMKSRTLRVSARTASEHHCKYALCLGGWPYPVIEISHQVAKTSKFTHLAHAPTLCSGPNMFVFKLTRYLVPGTSLMLWRINCGVHTRCAPRHKSTSSMPRARSTTLYTQVLRSASIPYYSYRS